jgi:antitoxin component of MazEF toxin-antitoxin module
MVALASVREHWLDDAPSVVVSASWLTEFGFEIGKKVVIEVTQGVITIKPVDCEEEG